MSSDQPPPQAVETNSLSLMNLTLLDPPRWGWTAAGGIADVLPSHERARRKRARTSYFAEKRPREKDQVEMQQGVTFADLGKGLPDHPDDGHSLSHSGEQDCGSHSTMPIEKSHLEENFANAAARLDGDNREQISFFASAQQTGDGSLRHASEISGDNGSLKQRDEFEQNETQQQGIFCSKGMTETSERSDKSNSNLKPAMIHPSAVNDAGVLDMFTYHRGREGQEPRDSKTGELLCDVEPTDSNFGLTQPKLKIPVSVEFPLHDGECATESDDPTSHDASAYYKDTVEWDLSNSSTPSPMEYALNVADEFGLNFGQTVDLAVSIQNQIDDYLRNNIAYSAPIAIRDPSGLERETRKPASFSLQLYGSVSGVDTYSGFPLSKKQRAISRSVFSSKAINNKPKSMPEGEAGNDRHTSLRFGYYDSSEIEEEYLAEIQKRAKAESEENLRERAAKEGVETGLKILETGNCHVCHKRHSNVAQFPCLIGTHIFCVQHCKSKLGITLTEGDDVTAHPVEFCPICSLSCNCIKCLRRLYVAAGELKRLHEARGTAIGEIELDKAIFTSVGSDMRASARAKSHPLETKLSSNKISNTAIRQGQGDQPSFAVPKVPASDFPREVCSGLDLDPGTAADYGTLYTADGSFLLSRAFESSGETTEVHELSAESSVQEDGNVDYCQRCRGPGNLLCCDFCPRAYHPNCLEPGIQVQTPWECPACYSEKGELAVDLVTGQTSLQYICAAFAGTEAGEGYQQGLQVLSVIHEMVNKLIDYDFGETFGEPVDLMIIGYKEMIKNPMDLGTIRDKLVNGAYVEHLSASGEWDEVTLAVLKDIELVWHNCFTFNREGSAIYRMAEVLRKRSLKIREASFEHLITEKVKAELANYIATCEAQRGKAARPVAAATHTQAQPNARYKITVKRPKGGVCRQVAVLDPDSGTVVKIYSTMKAAGIAASFLANNLGHACEWKSLTDLFVKGIIHRSTSNPNVYLFGYRWLLLDDLRGSRVRFPKKENQAVIVEMIDETGSYMFQSVEDALSYSGLPKNVPIDSLRRQISQITPGPEFTTLEGRSFRLLMPETRSASAAGELSSENAEAEISLVIDCQQFDAAKQNGSLRLPDNVVIVKEDIVARRKLAGYESAHSAYLDWVRTIDSSLVSLSFEARTEEHFCEYYLDGDRNIDGIVWRSAKPSGPSENEGNGSANCTSTVKLDSQPGMIGMNENGSHRLEAADDIRDIAIDFSLTSVPGSDISPPTAGDEEDGRSQKNGFHQHNQTNLHFLAGVTELEQAFPSNLSKVGNVESRLEAFGSYTTELLQTCQTVQMTRSSDSSEKILKPFRQ